MHFETITKLLNLPNIIVVDALDGEDDHLHLVVAFTDNADPPICSWCGAVHTSIHSRGQMRVEDLPSNGRRVFLYLEKRKCRCPDGGIHVEYLPWLHGRFYAATNLRKNQEFGEIIGTLYEFQDTLHIVGDSLESRKDFIGEIRRKGVDKVLSETTENCPTPGHVTDGRSLSDLEENNANMKHKRIDLIYKGGNFQVTRLLSNDDTIHDVVREIVFLLQGATYSQDQILNAFKECQEELGA